MDTRREPLLSEPLRFVSSESAGNIDLIFSTCNLAIIQYMYYDTEINSK